MKYENINYLYLLPLVFVMALAYIVFFKSKQNALKRFVQAELMDSIVMSVSRRKQIIKAVFVISAILFLIFPWYSQNGDTIGKMWRGGELILLLP